MKKLIFVIVSLFCFVLSASKVAVVDSGTDFDHVKLQGHAWVNTNEAIGNMIDDDNNGKVDDIVGWNFADNYGKVFFPEHLSSIKPIVFKIFEVLAKIQLGTVTQEDKDFWNTNVASLPEDKKKELLDNLNFYGQYAHSTHCSGIIALGNPNAKIMSARIFPDSLPTDTAQFLGESVIDRNPLYTVLAYSSNQVFVKVSDYLKETQMDVANYSLGVSLPAIAKKYLSLWGTPTEEEIITETQKLFEAFEPIGKEWMQNSSNTLFVIAAGNDGVDNDVYPYFPANVSVDNAITVAATKDFEALASFSNYGKTTVHVAAPGVAIMSTVPDTTQTLMLPMSGTSMAAPYVSMVSSLLKDTNPKLTPKEIKIILMETSDKKEWLKDKVISGGVVNSERAVKTAYYSNYMSVYDAIVRTSGEISDVPIKTVKRDRTYSEMQKWSKQLTF